MDICDVFIQLPYGFEISDECRTLLVGLLQRDPDQRMDFDDFFAHPYVDLDHSPSPNALPKAVSFFHNCKGNNAFSHWTR